MKNFSIGDSIHKGWKLTENNFGLVLRLVIIGFGLSITSNFLNRVGANTLFPNSLVFACSAIAVSILSLLVHIGFFKFGLQLIDGIKPKMSNLLSYSNYFWRFIGGSILYVVMIGAVFLASLAIIIFLSLVFHSRFILAIAIISAFLTLAVAVQYMFTIPLIVDQNFGPIEAMKKSSQMTHGKRIDLFAFIVVAILINILGAVCMLIGLLISVPITFFAYLIIYRQILKGGTLSPISRSSNSAPTPSPIQSRDVPLHILQ